MHVHIESPDGKAKFWLETPEGKYFVAFSDHPDLSWAIVAKIHNSCNKQDKNPFS